MKKELLLLIGFTAVLVGCGEDTGTPPPPPMSQAQVDANVEKIKNDPNMPPQLKERAMAGVRAAAEMQRQQAEAAKKRKAGGS